jgi:hypothetical protein
MNARIQNIKNPTTVSSRYVAVVRAGNFQLFDFLLLLSLTSLLVLGLVILNLLLR